MWIEKKLSYLVYSAFNFYNLRKIKKVIDRIDEFADEIAKLSDEELKHKYQYFKNMESSVRQKDRNIIPYTLTMVKEAFFRVYKITPYEEQYTCALGMYNNFITEMKSGEGKSIAAIITSILFSLDKKVHVITVNDYLAERDYKKAKDIYELFGLIVDINFREKPDKSSLYSCDIVYSSSMELIFDYLRNELAQQNERFSFPMEAVIIDEIDFVLLDNANSNFSVSTGLGYKPQEDIFYIAKEICSLLKGTEVDKTEYSFEETEPDTHYVYCYANNSVYLTQLGTSFLEKFLKVNYAQLKNLKLYKIIINTLEAKLFYANGRDYIVSSDKIILINRVNGRVMPNSQLEDDLHTAIEVKEGVSISEKPLLCNSLSYQLFFSKYGIMTGMSGTIYDASKEFENIFLVPTIVIPTHKENKRVDSLDMYFKTNSEKYNYLINYLKSQRKKNQPILIITSSEEESFELQKLLKDNGIISNLLNNQSSYNEVRIILNAGIHNAITVSTNMSGRGTDIVLDDEAKQAGGLLVIALNRYTSKRIDNQVRGRAGRQGDIGECIFYISLEDEIWNHLNKRQSKKARGILKNHPKILSNINEDSEDIYLQRRRIAQILDGVQDVVQINLLKSREMNYFLDSVIEKQRNLIFKWKDELKDSPMEFIDKYLTSDDFILSELNSTFEDKTSLFDVVHEQYEKIGETHSKLLIRSLIDTIVDKQWLVYKKCMESIKVYIPMYNLPEENMAAEYIRICFEELERMQIDSINIIIVNFICAKVEIDRTDEKERDGLNEKFF